MLNSTLLSLSLFFLLGKNEKKTPRDLVEVPERPQNKTEHVVCIWACGALGRALRTLIASSHLLLGWKPTLPYGFFIPMLHLAVRLLQDLPHMERRGRLTPKI